MAKELWAYCEQCKSDFHVVPDEQRKMKIDQIIAGQSGGILVVPCPKGHSVTVDVADKSKVSVRGR
jgi:hypothetical protein